MSTSDIIPIIDLKAFQFLPEEDNSFLYFELEGERQIEKPHKHDFFLFLLFERGSGTHTIDFIDHQVGAHQLHLLFPGQVHKWELGTSTLAYQLMMSNSVFENFANTLRFSFVRFQAHPIIELSAEQFQNLLYEFKAIQGEMNRQAVSWTMINTRTMIIAQFTNRFAEQLFEDQYEVQQPILTKFLSLIDQQFKVQRSVAFYANQLHITPNYLNILCKRHLHQTATQLIYSRIILEAKRLIQISALSFKEIAYELGFNDPAYFSNFFKYQTGISPRQFKDEL